MEEEDYEEGEEEEDDIDDVDTDLNIPINKNIANSKNPVSILSRKGNGLLDKIKLKNEEDKQ